MKVYFTGSLHNIDIEKLMYGKLVKSLEKRGHKVKAPLLGTTREEVDEWSKADRSAYYKKLKRNVAWADVVVAEASFPSTVNIGHEVSLALDAGKPIVCLHLSGREPGVLQGLSSDRFVLLEYSEEDMNEVLDYGLEEAEEQMDVRFNFFISPKIGNYLDNISKTKKIPRAVYLRQLIEEDMGKNEEYQE